MYGSISRFKVKPGKWEALRQSIEAGPRAEGPAAVAAFRMDDDGDEYYVVMIAESEKAYRSNSERPDMHEAYLERLQWLESEPEWHDGKVLTFRRYPAPEGAKLYGSIAEMQVKPGAIEALANSDNGDRQPEGAVALCIFQMDADPNQFFAVAISESEAAYRTYSESQRSQQRYGEMVKWLEHEPKWHDGQVLEYRVSFD
jgi:quinol monooxygenase YgiN